MPGQTPVDVTHPPAERAATYERRRRAAEMRRQGAAWDDIAAECGYASKGAAHTAVRALMIESRDLAYGEADLYRAESLERLMDLYQVAWPLAKRGSEKHMIVCLRIIKQMGELRGENMPIKVEIEEADVDRSLRELVAEFERRAALAAASEAAGDQAPTDQDRRGRPTGVPPPVPDARRAGAGLPAEHAADPGPRCRR